ncbi:siderophore-interacting protein [Psychromicrobium sp. YIM B11713]|uniref:siderophore-interacting protein n=1 Tax=Psychromicrobium sp. YIM B11713 TaxID=3145233 RepID=UPI00374F2EE3
MAERFERALLKAYRAADFELEVLSNEAVAENLRKVRFHCAEFMSRQGLHPGVWLRLWIPGDKGRYQRGYTAIELNHADDTFAIEFYLHGGPGLAQAWAQQASAGDRLSATLYTGKDAFSPGKAPQTLLIGDPTSLPAINEICASIEGPVTVILEAANEADRRLPTATEVKWVAQSPGGIAVIEALGDLRLDHWACFIAAESHTVKQLRRIVLERGASKSLLKARGYWTRGKSMGGKVDQEP